MSSDVHCILLQTPLKQIKYLLNKAQCLYTKTVKELTHPVEVDREIMDRVFKFMSVITSQKIQIFSRASQEITIFPLCHSRDHGTLYCACKSQTFSPPQCGSSCFPLRLNIGFNMFVIHNWGRNVMSGFLFRWWQNIYVKYLFIAIFIPRGEMHEDLYDKKSSETTRTLDYPPGAESI